MPADTAFTPRFLQTADVIVAMYHDQGLPVIKHVGFGNAVNITLGLPILRTSVDHGTALELGAHRQSRRRQLARRAGARHRDLAAHRARVMPVRKRFGQHFLHDPGVIRRIIDAVAPVAGERVVEIGPGRGALTWGCCERAKRLDVIEIDRDLARALQADPRAQAAACACTSRTCSTPTSCRLRGAGEPLRVVGNLPYNISTPLLFRLLTQRAAIADMHFMLQKEVVDRMAAQPWNQGLRPADRHARGRRRGRSAVRCRSRRFQAAAQGLVRHRAAAADAEARASTSVATACCAPLVTAAFSHRRKTLRNS